MRVSGTRRSARARVEPRSAMAAWLALALPALIALLLAACAETPRVALTAIEAQDIAECRLVEALDGDTRRDSDGERFHRCLAGKGY